MGASIALGRVWSETGRRGKRSDQLQRMLEVLRLDSGKWTLLGTWLDDARVRAEPFDAIELDLGVLWADVELSHPPFDR